MGFWEGFAIVNIITSHFTSLTDSNGYDVTMITNSIHNRGFSLILSRKYSQRKESSVTSQIGTLALRSWNDPLPFAWLITSTLSFFLKKGSYEHYEYEHYEQLTQTSPLSKFCICNTPSEYRVHSPCLIICKLCLTFLCLEGSESHLVFISPQCQHFQKWLLWIE